MYAVFDSEEEYVLPNSGIIWRADLSRRFNEEPSF